MEIKRKELRQFIVHWINTKKIKISILEIVDLLDLIDECYENKMMFDSWFRGVDVMN